MRIIILLLFSFIVSCNTTKLSPVEKVLTSAHPALLKVLHDPDGFEIQLKFTSIRKDSLGKPQFLTDSFRAADSTYFYPASTVKLPVAVLALEWLSSQENITLNTPYNIEGDSLTHTIEEDIDAIFTVSDNKAYNRLYELLGRDYINSRMHQLNLKPFRLAHRLSTPNADNSQKLKITFKNHTITYGGGNDLLLEQLAMNGVLPGNAFYKDGKRIETPMDFSSKNYFPINTQHELMMRLFYPNQFSEDKQFKIKKSYLDFLKTSMQKTPREAGYLETEYPDGYVKFFMFGDASTRIPEHIQIYNKVGYAYGTLTETAYIKDTKHDVAFFLSATILVNSNATFNDDTYDYDTVGIPFMAQLGRAFYYEALSGKD